MNFFIVVNRLMSSKFAYVVWRCAIVLTCPTSVSKMLKCYTSWFPSWKFDSGPGNVSKKFWDWLPWLFFNIAKDLKLFYVNQLQPKQAYTWRPSSWHIRHFKYGILIPRSKFFRHFFSSLLMITWAVITSLSKIHLTSHSNGIHHLQKHATDLRKLTMTHFTTHWKKTA